MALYETDILTLLQRYKPTLDPIFDELKPHLDAGAFEELRKIVADVERRIAGMEAAHGDKPPPGE